MKIFDAIYESSQLYNEDLLESLLVEDKMVKYDGELAPKFGWCVIYAGGAAAGKSTATEFLSRLQGRYYNVDDFKKMTKDTHDNKRWHMTNRKTGEPYVNEFPSPNERDLGGSFAGQLHNTFDELNIKKQNFITHNPEERDPSRLPNLIFDVTGKRLGKFTEIIGPAKEMGYKIAVLWVMSTPDKAVKMAKKRGRGYGPRGLSPEGLQDLVTLHKQVTNAIVELFDSGYIENVDEFWAIDNAIDVNPKADPVGFHNAQNAYHIECTPDGLKHADPIVQQRIIENTTEHKIEER